MLKAGDNAPDFSLEDKNGKITKLSDYKGQKLLLYFYPKADTPGCTTQACSIRDASADLGKKGMTSIGISPDVPKKQKLFADKFELNFPLLSDPDHAVADAYGAWGEKKLFGRTYMGLIRSTFVINEAGTLIRIFLKVRPKNHSQQVLQVLAEARAA